MDPALQELLLAELDPDEIVEALVRLTDENTIPDKLTPISKFGDIISCRIRRSDILDVYNSELTKSMKASRFVAYNRDTEINGFSKNYPSEQSFSTEATGNNTIVAVLDWGIDFAHPNFRNSDGSTRFIAIWDQSFRDDAGLAPYGYGRLFKREQINQALQSRTPYKRLKYHPGKSDSLGIGTHGTHVMDIAAGNGKIGNKGVASEADLIFVHLASRGTSGTGNLGDSVRILEGINAVKTIAGDQSLVINMSIGRHGGPHDGLTLVEQGIDNFLESRNNTMICQSTGNYYKENAHHSGIVRPGKIKTFSFLIHRADKTLNEMEIWYQGNDQFGIELINNQSGKSFKCSINSRQNIILNGKRIGRIYHRDSEPNNGKNHINLFLYKNAPSGRWTVKLIGEKVSDGRYHAWIERDGSCKNCQSRFDPSFADVASTTGTIANGFNSIVCGAFDATSRSFAMAPFSSKGPTLDGRSKPDIVASGRYISAARSTPVSSEIPRPSITRMSGTSMASPRVAGATALVLEQLPPNTPFWQIRNIIIGTANPVKTREPSRVGAGKLNIPAAINTAKRIAERVLNRKKTLVPIVTTNTFRLPIEPDAYENISFPNNTSTDQIIFTPVITISHLTEIRAALSKTPPNFISAPSSNSRGGAYHILDGLPSIKLVNILNSLTSGQRNLLLSNVGLTAGVLNEPRLRLALKSSMSESRQLSIIALNIFDAVRSVKMQLFAPVFALFQSRPRIELLDIFRLFDQSDITILNSNINHAIPTQRTFLTEVFKDILGSSGASPMAAPDVIDLSVLRGIDKTMASIYNQYGQILHSLALANQFPTGVLAGIFKVESGGRSFDKNTNAPFTRFEAHVFWRRWGKLTPTKRLSFHNHFKFGQVNSHGRLVESKKHKFRINPSNSWTSIHVGNQSRERAALKLASNLQPSNANEMAHRSASFGLPQVMGFNFASLGYANAVDMANDFNSSERSQIVGMVNFLQNRARRVSGRIRRLKTAVKMSNYYEIGRQYNGNGNVYGPKIRTAALSYQRVTQGKRFA